MLNKKDIMNKMVIYLEGNIQEAKDIASQVNSYDGSLEDLHVYDMSEFNYIIDSMELDPMELICKVQYGDFNVDDDYFAFDRLGNLVSYQEWGYERLIRNYIPVIINRYIDLAGHVYADDEMEALMCEYEECE